MNGEFQTIAAWAIVALTVFLFLKKAQRKGKKNCEGGCGCTNQRIIVIPKSGAKRV